MMPEKIENIFKPDPALIRQHLEFLFEGTHEDYKDGMIEISILTNSEYFPISDIEGAVKKAVLWNENHNVYTTAALLTPDIKDRIKERGGRAKAEDFYACNAVWADLDDIKDDGKLKDIYKDAPPNALVITGRAPNLRKHLWWELDATTTYKEGIERANKGLIQKLQGDKGTHNCTRLMRIGGSIAWPKKEGRITEETEFHMNTSWMPPHNLADLVHTYKYTEPTPEYEPHKKSTLNNLFTQDNEWSIDDIKQMLSFISPDEYYDDWVKIGMALKDHGIPFNVWDEWSSKGTKYPGTQELNSKWNSFKGTGTTIGTVYHFAHQGGFRASSKEPEPLGSRAKQESFDEDTGEVVPQPGNNPQGMYYITGDKVEFNCETNDFVQGLLGRGALSVVYGESNCGKTFFMTDLAFHIAEGKRWRSKRVEQGAVMYVVLEGERGLKGRIEAYKKDTGDKLDKFAMMPCPVDFMDPEGNINEFIELLHRAKEDLGDISLIVIDTLARAIAGGDENSGQDMGILVKHADYIREITDAHICFIHHSGKDKARGARGHSSLRAAVDSELEVDRDEDAGYSTVKVVKQREMEMSEDMAFSLKSVSLGVNKYNEEITSCVVEEAEIIESATNRENLSPNQQFAYDCVLQSMINHGVVREVYKGMAPVKCITYEEFRDQMDAAGHKYIDDDDKLKSATQAARNALKKKNYIGFNRAYIWLLDRNEDA